MKILKLVLTVVLSLFFLMVTGSLIRASSSTLNAEEIVNTFLESSNRVNVDNQRWLTFAPTQAKLKTGFIFYPGGNVSHKAYAPTLHRIAKEGFLVIDVSMPFDLAVLNPDKAMKIIEAYPEIDSWVIGGHSLGGAMAARFIKNNPGAVDGLVLWAAYPAESDSLADSSLPVISISGTLDGLANPRRIERSIPLLPENTIWVQIEGGNHAQFGFYGPQNRDNPAKISREEQQVEIINATVGFLNMVAP